MRTVLSWGQRGASRKISVSTGRPLFSALLCLGFLFSFYFLLHKVVLGSPRVSYLTGPQCTHLPRPEYKSASVESESIFPS